MKHDFEKEAEDIRREIVFLREKAPLYPDVAQLVSGELIGGRLKLSLTTMLLFEHEGKKYKRHHIATGLIEDGNIDDIFAIRRQLSFNIIESMEHEEPVIVNGKMLDYEATEEEWNSVKDKLEGIKREIEEAKEEVERRMEEEKKKIKEEEIKEKIRKAEEDRNPTWSIPTPDDSDFDSQPSFTSESTPDSKDFDFGGGSSGGAGASSDYDYDSGDSSSSSDSSSSTD